MLIFIKNFTSILNFIKFNHKNLLNTLKGFFIKEFKTIKKPCEIEN